MKIHIFGYLLCLIAYAFCEEIDTNAVCICGRNNENLNEAVNKTKLFIEQIRVSENIPGMVVGVSVKGKNIFIEPFGHIDIENDVKTRKDTVWRLASISKSLTTTLVSKLVEKGKIDFNQSIYHYLDEKIFPKKKWNGKTVDITVQQLMSHTGGIRVSKLPEDFYRILNANNVTDTLKYFKDEPLIYKPGTQFNYSNDGWQIVGALIESVMNQTYEKSINDMFIELEMNRSFVERTEKIIPNRARYYQRDNSTKQLGNAFIMDDLNPYNKYWPAGGLLSNVEDLLKFGTYMLDSNAGKTDLKSAFLRSTTVHSLWTPTIKIESDVFGKELNYYGKGWFITNLTKPIICNSCKSPSIKYYVSHAGGLNGLTTLLAIFPEQEMVISILTNIGGFGQILDIVLDVAKNFV